MSLHGLDKFDARWRNSLNALVGWSQTAVHMLGLQSQEVEIDRPYNRYEHLFSGLALCHLRFNYLKMIWDLFYTIQFSWGLVWPWCWHRSLSTAAIPCHHRPRRGLDVSWQGETARHEGLVSGGQEVGRSRQDGKGSRPLDIGGRLG